MNRLFVCESCGRAFFQGVQEKIMTELLKQEPLTGAQLAKIIRVSNASITKSVQKLLANTVPYVTVERNIYARNIKLISINPDFKATIESHKLRATSQ